ncbi:IucA/IucC family protein [Microbulbifer sp. 2304DJ12-6]|uniref:IucA/IucC family protein n=1 Tax=Microbulbifer sp. 2304DJ12-6 TaxID=3233340 RepID=UPI0039B025D0
MPNAQSSAVSIDRVAHQVSSNNPLINADGYSMDTAAERMSANCFFNALLRETGCGHWHGRSGGSLPDGIRAPAVRIPLPETAAELWLNVSYRSECGRHQFALPVVWRRGDADCSVIDLARTAGLVADEPSFFPGASKESRVQFVQRVTASVENMARTLRARKVDTERLFAHPLTFSEAEQGLLCGHSIHPTPKSCDPFTHEDAERYAPEFGNSFFLLWLGVDPEFLRGASGTEIHEKHFADLVRESDRGPRVPGKLIPVPAHPWQWQRLRREPRVAGLLENGNIVELGSGLVPWRATSSLRAVYSAQNPYMLKFSLSLRLTNSVRTLQPREMARGLEVLKVRNTPVGREFFNRYPRFQVLAEPAYLMLADSEGAPIIESLVMFRENPFRGQNASNTCLLATLTQDHPGGAPCRAAQLILQLAEQGNISAAAAARRWFTAFLDTVVEPLLIAQADFGILFGAHQQNLILSFEGSLPVAGYFRDCQGSGYSKLGEKLLKPHLPDLARKSGNVIDEQMANRLFVYYLIVNSCFGLISALAAAELLTERELLGQLRNRLQRLHNGPRRDRSCLGYLLQAPTLWSKGNFQCAIIGMNETTSDDPLSIYHTMENPLIDTSQRDSVQG